MMIVPLGGLVRLPVFVLVFAYLAVDAFYFDGVPEQRLLFALVLLTSFVSYTVLLIMGKVRLAPVQVCCFILFLYGFAPLVFAEQLHAKWVFGDASTLLLLGLSVSLVMKQGELPVLNLKQLVLFTTLLLLIALVGKVFGVFASRYEPPHAVGLVAAAALYYSVPRSTLSSSSIIRVFALIAFLVLLWLSFQSGQRTNVITGVAIAAYVFLRGRGKLSKIAFVLIVGLIVAAFSSLASVEFGDSVRNVVSGSRFSSVLQGDDSSLGARGIECSESINYLSDSSVGGARLLLGAGHGGVYRPIKHFNDRNITDDGFLHNIHVGACMLSFRYGLLGLSFYGFIGVLTIFYLLYWSSVNKVDLSNPLNRTLIFWPLLLLAFSLDFLVRNVMADPLYLLLVGSALQSALSLVRRRFRSQAGAFG